MSYPQAGFWKINKYKNEPVFWMASWKEQIRLPSKSHKIPSLSCSTSELDSQKKKGNMDEWNLPKWVSFVFFILTMESCTLRSSMMFWIFFAAPLDNTSGIRLGTHWSRFCMKVDSRLVVVILLYSSLICVTHKTKQNGIKVVRIKHSFSWNHTPANFY